MRGETGASRLANAIAAPQWLAIAFLAVAAAFAGYGWSLVVLLALAAIASMLLAALVWRAFVRLWPHPGVFTSMGVGLFLGAAAAAISFGAVSLDRDLSKHFGGSLLQDAAGAAAATGMKAGNDAFKTGTAIDVVTIPYRAVTAFAGGMLAVAVLAAVMLGVIALPILTGLFGGLSAALRARRSFRERELASLGTAA